MASGNEESRFPDPTFTIETDNHADELNICTEANNDLLQSLNWNNHEMKVIRGNQLLEVPRQIVYEPDLFFRFLLSDKILNLRPISIRNRSFNRSPKPKAVSVACPTMDRP